MEQASRSGWMSSERMRRDPCDGGKLAAGWGAVYNCSSTWSRLGCARAAMSCNLHQAAGPNDSILLLSTDRPSLKATPVCMELLLVLLFFFFPFGNTHFLCHSHTHPHTLNQSSPNPSLSHHTETKRALISDRTVGCNDNV